MRVITINQPALFPRLHLFDRAAVADRYVYLGSAQFARRSTEQSVVALSDGTLRFPVEHQGRQSLDETCLRLDERWARKALARIRHHYGKQPGYERWSGYVEEILRRGVEGATVGALGRETFEVGLEAFGVEVELVEDTALCEPIRGEPSGWMMELTRLAGGDLYYFGGAALAGYFDTEAWDRAGIRWCPQEWAAVRYADDIAPNLSMLDVLLRGDEAVAAVADDLRHARARMDAQWAAANDGPA